jgi:hypothetical protein
VALRWSAVTALPVAYARRDAYTKRSFSVQRDPDLKPRRGLSAPGIGCSSRTRTPSMSDEPRLDRAQGSPPRPPAAMGFRAPIRSRRVWSRTPLRTRYVRDSRSALRSSARARSSWATRASGSRPVECFIGLRPESLRPYAGSGPHAREEAGAPDGSGRIRRPQSGRPRMRASAR